MKKLLSGHKLSLKPRSLVLALVLIIAIGGASFYLIVNKGKSPVKTTTAAKQGPGKFASADSQVMQKVNLLQELLENYRSNNSPSYPAELSPDVLSNQPGISGDASSMFVPPAGITYVYAALPKGCTTAGKDCIGFTLEAKDAKGTVVYTAKSAK